jgi:squalene-hopene/tetraprenyl-beta-curcumene cyclase
MAFVQSCISPVWDTSIAMMTYQALDDEEDNKSILKSPTDWLKKKQIAINGDWVNSANVNLNLPLNGWAFQDFNDHYPDLDDTAMVILALRDQQGTQYQVNCASLWLTTMQSKNGGFGAFDANNTTNWINDIPFADHKCMLDPPTADVSGRVLAAIYDQPSTKYYSQKKLINYLLKEQTPAGLWWGRWGTCWTWGTWSVVMGLCKFPNDERVKQALIYAANCLIRDIVNTDGGFGESNWCYKSNIYEHAKSNAFNTSLVILTLTDIYRSGCYMDAELVECVQKAVRWLLDHQLSNGSWPQSGINAPGFPKVFYLHYHGYAYYFPVWALSSAKQTFAL